MTETQTPNSAVFDRWRQRVAEMRDVRAALNQVGEAWAEECRRLCPIGENWTDDGAAEGGALRDSIRWVPDGATSGYIEMLKYGDYVVSGHGEYTIDSPNVMHFYWPKVADFVYAHSVTIPEQPANDFVQRAWESRRVQDIIKSLPIRIRRRV